MEEQQNYSGISQKNAKVLLLAGACIIGSVLTIAAIRAMYGNMESTGQFGDAMGGITAPFLNLIGACLVFFALKSQVQANGLVQEQIKDAKREKELAAEAENLNQLYKYLDDNIKGFRFTNFPQLDKKDLENSGSEVEYAYAGGEAFDQIFYKMRCDYHGEQEDLDSYQSVAELISILTLMDLLISKLLLSKCNNTEILLTLVKHQFDYKISTNIKKIDINELVISYCDHCKCDHGLPEHIRILVKNIQKNLAHVA